MAIDEKYVVFRRDDFNDIFTDNNLIAGKVRQDLSTIQVKDAVVIRTQDIFAAPALDAYANSISVALMIMGYKPGDPHPELANTADYFHERATEAWRREDKKIPD